MSMLIGLTLVAASPAPLPMTSYTIAPESASVINPESRKRRGDDDSESEKRRAPSEEKSRPTRNCTSYFFFEHCRIGATLPSPM